jgi:hypothetical protein
MPDAEDRCPVDPDIPECATGPVGRVRFVASELRDVWRELHAHREPRSRNATANDDGPESDEQGSE